MAAASTTSSDRCAPSPVVVLGTGELDTVVTLGAARHALPEVPRRRDEWRGEGLHIDEPNLEKIAALQPDLILSNKVRHEQIYDKLSAITATVFAADVGNSLEGELPPRRPGAGQGG